MIEKRLLLLIVTICFCITVFSQKVKTVSAEYTYYAPETMSVEEAKRTALNRAKIEAIANEFGTLVTQNSSTLISSKNGKTDSQVTVIGGSDVKGEWIETLGEPKFNIEYRDNQLIIHCAVKGKVREIVSAGVEYIAEPLRNGTSLKFKSKEFRDGDDLYLYFKTPIDGFLAVYLLDEAKKTVYCILPYKSQGNAVVAVKNNTEYIFFCKDKADISERSIIDEYTLTAESEIEYNTLYVLFSPSEFGKQIGFDDSFRDLPNNISLKKFTEWLSRTLSKDNKIQFREFNISISK